jgi:hypothetical protein
MLAFSTQPQDPTQSHTAFGSPAACASGRALSPRQFHPLLVFGLRDLPHLGPPLPRRSQELRDVFERGVVPRAQDGEVGSVTLTISDFLITGGGSFVAASAGPAFVSASHPGGGGEPIAGSLSVTPRVGIGYAAPAL